MIKVAVIGCGKIANSAHIPSYMNCPDAEIKYFCDIIPERAAEAVEKYGIKQAPTLIVIKNGEAEAIVNASNIRKYAENL